MYLRAGGEGVSGIEDVMMPIKEEMELLKGTVNRQDGRLKDIENRLTRSNVRIIGLQEKSEGNNMRNFLEKWLQQIFGREELSPFFTIERAHRVPSKMSAPGGMPRSVIMKLLFFNDRETILRKVRELKDIMFNGVKVSFFRFLCRSAEKESELCGY